MRSSCVTEALDQVTPLTITYNEESNIVRTLAGLSWASRIVVIDSFSTDRTLELLAADVRVEVFQRQFDNFASQCNFGLQHIHTPWVLSLDADYLITQALRREMEVQLSRSSPLVAGYLIPFRYCVAGKPLRGTILPPRIALYRPECGRYVTDGHAHRLQLSGPCAKLCQPIHHDDRKSLDRWLLSQHRYLRQECQKIRSTPPKLLSGADQLRRGKLLAPLAVFVYCLVLKGGWLDGWRGWFYALQRTYVELLLGLMLIEADMGGEP
jgi:glycosyltransferase involved in cell wall biosynthesis